MSANTVAVADGLDPDVLRALLAQPAAALAAGGLVAFPTETVYGLGADALSAVAVRRIFSAKGRPNDNPLIVHLADRSWLEQVATSTPLAQSLADRFWPGPLTLVLDRSASLPAITTAGLDTVAVRVPSSIVARTLISLAKTPVAAPSANRSGRPSPTTAQHVAVDLDDVTDWIIDGGSSAIGIESTVVDARGDVPLILRDGAVTREMLGHVGGGDVDLQRSPGTRHRHYQPLAAVVIAPAGTGVEVANAALDRSRRVGLVAAITGGVDPDVTVLATPADGDELAQVLYAALRQADMLGLASVVVEAVADQGVGRAVMDRLRRAGTPNDPA